MSLTTAVRSLNRSARSKFPGADDGDLAVYLQRVFEAAATNLKSTYKDEDAVAAADQALAEAAENGEAWALGLRDSKLLNIVKPTVDKAKAKGVDPVTALLLEDFSEAEAREYVAALEARASEADTTPVTPDADDSDADDSNAPRLAADIQSWTPNQVRPSSISGKEKERDLLLRRSCSARKQDARLQPDRRPLLHFPHAA